MKDVYSFFFCFTLDGSRENGIMHLGVWVIKDSKVGPNLGSHNPNSFWLSIFMKTGLHKSQLAYILHEYAFHGKRGMYLFDDCSELIKQLAHAAYSTSILNLLLVIWLWKNFNECKYIILEKKFVLN